MRTTTRTGGYGRRAFSLVEVIVAVGICAATVVGVVALFGPTVRDTREVMDRRTSQRLAEQVSDELQRGGFAAVTAATVSGGAMQLVARADGSHVVLLGDADNDPTTGVPRGIPPPERYFGVAVTRAGNPASGPAWLVLEVRVSWPLALPPDGAIVPSAQRSDYRFHTAINR
jgi:type II secretory pathway pseudopilin PulG